MLITLGNKITINDNLHAKGIRVSRTFLYNGIFNGTIRFTRVTIPYKRRERQVNMTRRRSFNVQIRYTSANRSLQRTNNRVNVNLVTSLVRTTRRRTINNTTLIGNGNRAIRHFRRRPRLLRIRVARNATSRRYNGLLTLPINNLTRARSTKRRHIIKTSLSKGSVNLTRVFLVFQMSMMQTKDLVRLKRNTILRRVRRIETRRTKRTRVSHILTIRPGTLTRGNNMTLKEMTLRI